MPSNDTTFTVTEEQLKNQLLQGTTWHSNHRVWNDPSMQVITSDGPRTAMQVVYFLATGKWHDEFFNNCGVDNCITGLHNSLTKAHADEVRDAEDSLLIQQNHQQSVSLAALYRKGKARGLLRSATTYGG